MPDDALLARSLTATVEMIQPKSGKYQVSPIPVGNDYVAIVPIAVKKESSIIVPDEEPTVGIIVGIGPLVPQEMRTAFIIGNTVKFNPKQFICNLDGLYAAYGKARVVLTRYHNILAAVEGDPVMVVGVDKAAGSSFEDIPPKHICYVLENLQDRACNTPELTEFGGLVKFTGWIRSLYPEFYSATGK